MRYTMDELALDTVAGTVSRGGERLEVSGLTLAFFTALVEAAPEALDADQLAQTVWGRAHVTDETIRKRVSLLRAALGAEMVRTLPNRRYALAVSVTQVAADDRDQTPVSPSPSDASDQAPDPAPAIPAPALTRPLMIAGAVAIVVLLGAAVWTSLQPDEPPRLVNPETGDVLEAPGL